MQINNFNIFSRQKNSFKSKFIKKKLYKKKFKKN